MINSLRQFMRMSLTHPPITNVSICFPLHKSGLQRQGCWRERDSDRQNTMRGTNGTHNIILSINRYSTYNLHLHYMTGQRISTALASQSVRIRAAKEKSNVYGHSRCYRLRCIDYLPKCKVKLTIFGCWIPSAIVSDAHQVSAWGLLKSVK